MGDASKLHIQEDTYIEDNYEDDITAMDKYKHEDYNNDQYEQSDPDYTDNQQENARIASGGYLSPGTPTSKTKTRMYHGQIPEERNEESGMEDELDLDDSNYSDENVE